MRDNENSFPHLKATACLFDADVFGELSGPIRRFKRTEEHKKNGEE